MGTGVHFEKSPRAVVLAGLRSGDASPTATALENNARPQVRAVPEYLKT